MSGVCRHLKESLIEVALALEVIYLVDEGVHVFLSDLYHALFWQIFRPPYTRCARPVNHSLIFLVLESLSSTISEVANGEVA